MSDVQVREQRQLSAGPGRLASMMIQAFGWMPGATWVREDTAPRSTTPWQPGPRGFVGRSRGPDVMELGRPGDFVPGAHVWGPQAGDPGFPHGTRWPGYPSEWVPPFFTVGGPLDQWGPFGWASASGMLTGRVAIVYSCVDLASRVLATLPLQFNVDSEPVLPASWWINPEPLVYPSIVDFFKAVINSLLLRGNAYIVATARDPVTGLPIRFVCMSPDYVSVEPGPDGVNTYWLGLREWGLGINRADILHLRYQIWPGDCLGVGPLEAAWRNVASDSVMEAYAARLAGRGGVPNAVLTTDQALTETQAKTIKQSWREAAWGTFADPMVLGHGVTYTPMMISPKDLALLDTRAWDETRIAAAFATPNYLVNLPQQYGLTYSTAEGVLDYYWRTMLKPMGHNITLALSNWCLPAGEFVRFDADQFVRPEIGARASAYAALIGANVMTSDEARALENLPPLARSDPSMLAKATTGGI